MELQEILKLTAKKYPAGTKAGWLGAILIIYDDGTGYIRKSGTENREYSRETLFHFSTIEELVNHLKGA